MTVEIHRRDRNNVVISKNNVQNVSVAGGIKGDKGDPGVPGPRQYVGETPPGNPTVGDQWLNSLTARQYVYLDDSWVEIGASFQGQVGPPGPQGIQGVQGIQGPVGPGVSEGGDAGSLLRKASNSDFETEWITPDELGILLKTNRYIHEQQSVSAEWVITHELGGRPSVTIVDSGGTTVFGEVVYNSDSQVTVYFSSPFSGSAYLT